MSDERPFVAAPVRVSRAYEELAAGIRGRILAGELQAGDRLPSETTLGAQARVGRSTVREALRVLQEAGYIERVTPKVMVVRRRSPEPLRELSEVLNRGHVTFRDLHEAMLVIDPELAKLAALRATPDDLAQLTENLRRQEQALDDVDAFNALDEEFHQGVARISGNLALVVCRMPITDILLPTLHRFMSAGRMPQTALGFHRRILEELEAGDPEGASFAARRHINDFRKAWEAAGNDYGQKLGQLDQPGRTGSEEDRPLYRSAGA